MHILLGLLGTIVTILVLFKRLADAGIGLGGLNPFLWHRRRNWRQKVEGNPVYQISTPMDATAILMLAVAKADGDLSREDKTQLLDLFESEFKLSKTESADLLSSSAHLLGEGSEVRDNIAKFLSKSKANFSAEQAQSAIDLITRTANENSTQNENADLIVQEATDYLQPEKQQSSQVW